MSRCQVCGDDSTTLVCSDCQREEGFRLTADRWLRSFRLETDETALSKLEFPTVTKCALCEQYYGPYSMQIHLQEDHKVGLSREDRNEIRNEAYNEGYEDGQEDRIESYEF